LKSFNPEQQDNDIYTQDMKGLGRGKGFRAENKRSALDEPEVVRPIAIRSLGIIDFLYEAGKITDADLIKTSTFKAIIRNVSESHVGSRAPQPEAFPSFDQLPSDEIPVLESMSNPPVFTVPDSTEAVKQIPLEPKNITDAQSTTLPNASNLLVKPNVPSNVFRSDGQPNVPPGVPNSVASMKEEAKAAAPHSQVQTEIIYVEEPLPYPTRSISEELEAIVLMYSPPLTLVPLRNGEEVILENLSDKELSKLGRGVELTPSSVLTMNGLEGKAAIMDEIRRREEQRKRRDSLGEKDLEIEILVRQHMKYVLDELKKDDYNLESRAPLVARCIGVLRNDGLNFLLSSKQFVSDVRKQVDFVSNTLLSHLVGQLWFILLLVE